MLDSPPEGDKIHTPAIGCIPGNTIFERKFSASKILWLNDLYKPMPFITNLVCVMKNFLILFLFALFLTGCEKAMDVSVNSPLMNCSAEYLDFQEV